MPPLSARVEGEFARAAAEGGEVRGAEEWRAFLRLVHQGGLLPQQDLIKAVTALSFPIKWADLAEQIARDREPAGDVEGLIADAASRVRHLHTLLAEWQLPNLSDVHTHRLLSLVQSLHAELEAGRASLSAWESDLKALGQEDEHTLFWDLVDPATSSARPRPHAFQREHLRRIEQRCSHQRVSSALTNPPSEATTPLISRLLGKCPQKGFRVTVVRASVDCAWEEMAELLQEMDATRQMCLSIHAPAYYGEEIAPPTDGCASYWYIEPPGGESLYDLLASCGPVEEESVLFMHWRQQLSSALLHVSAHTTFSLRDRIGLEHAHVVDGGVRIVLHGLPWGAEFPEPAVMRGTPLARTPASASTFHATEDEGDSAPTAADAAEPFDFAMWRDRWLVGDCVNMLTQLLLGIAMRIEEAELDVGAVKGLSAEFCAIRAACRRNPPTLLQLSSHKYFAPLGEAQQNQVELEFIRYAKRRRETF